MHPDFVSVPFSPAGIHPHEHGGPVIAFGPPCPGVDLEKRTQFIPLVAQHAFQFLFLDPCEHFCRLQIKVILGSVQLGKHLQILQAFPDPGISIQGRFQQSLSPEQDLCFLWIVPEIRFL
jgi:hypothetical protein